VKNKDDLNRREPALPTGQAGCGRQEKERFSQKNFKPWFNTIKN
jgi:hypothetical protein